jgi:hypothetical protein
MCLTAPHPRLPRRRWCGISGFAGFYVANTVSLSFGALAVNDIVAAALAVTFVELVTRAFYTAWPNPCVPSRCAARPRTQRLRRLLTPLDASRGRPFSLWLLHCFKVRHSRAPRLSSLVAADSQSPPARLSRSWALCMRSSATPSSSAAEAAELFTLLRTQRILSPKAQQAVLLAASALSSLQAVAFKRRS